MEIHQVKGRLVNSYVIEDCDQLFVVDVATQGEKYVLGFIEQVLKRSLQEVALVMSTHDDPDHIGGVRRLAKQCNAKIAYPLASLDPLVKLVNDPMGMVFRFSSGCAEALRSRSWEMYFNAQRDAAAELKPTADLDSEIVSQHKVGEPDYRLKGGDYVPGFPDWRVLHTPGHTWDSCCFYHEPTKSLLTGDTLLGSKKKGGVVTPSIYSNPFHLSETIKNLRKLEPAFICPGHGSCFRGENLLAHL